MASINLTPHKVVLVGASAKDESLSGQLHRNVLTSWPASQIDLINPKLGGTQLRGSAVFSSLSDSPKDYDMALICVRADRVVSAVAECAQMGVSTCVIYSSGFGEVGESGANMEQELKEVAREYGIRIIGPNSQGLILSQVSLIGTFSQAAAGQDPDLPLSSIAYIGQSGAIGGSVLGMLNERGIGLGDWITVGNQTDIDCVEAAAALLQNSQYSAIGLYLESLPEGQAWQRLVNRCHTTGTKIVLLRSGLTESGKKAAASHTGSIVGDSHSFDVFNTDSGVIEAGDVCQFVEILVLVASSFATLQTPLMTVLTSSGGVGALCADHASMGKVDLSVISDPAQQQIASNIPDYGSSSNPVDVTAQLFGGSHESLKALGNVLEILAEDSPDGFTLIALTNVTGKQAQAVAEEISAASAKGATIAVLWLTNGDLILEAVKHLRQHGVPVLTDLPQFLDNVSKLISSNLRTVQRSETQNCADYPEPPLVFSAAPGQARGLSAEEYRVLENYGIEQVPAFSLNPRHHTAPPEEWMNANPSGDFVVKIDSPHIQHKTEAGGVRLGVAADEISSAVSEVWTAANEAVPGVDHERVTVQYQIPQGLELLVSVTGSADGFPPILTVGMGGVTTELFKDVCSSTAPVNRSSALELLRGLQMFPLLEGFRGMPGIDLAALSDQLSQLSTIGHRLPKNSVLEINPIRIIGSHVYCLDSLLVTS